MRDTFLTNYSETSFLDKIKDNLKHCNAFFFSVSFIKKAGLVLIERELEEALNRGAEGKIITSTYQNFTDIESLKIFLDWTKEYGNFECHLDMDCFGDNGFHSKGYLFDYNDCTELVVGSSNITRFALLKNVEWNVSITSKQQTSSYTDAMNQFEYLWDRTYELNSERIKKYGLRLEYAIEKWDMDYINPDALAISPNRMQRKALKEIRRYRDMGVNKALVISATGSGKTYLAAFDAHNYGAKRLLYVVHRDMILKSAKETFQNVFGAERSYGLYTGVSQNIDCDFIFASTDMISRHLDLFDKDEFDYIVYDEVHHIVAETGKKIFNYFQPDFMLGLTATPERMDNKDIFELFDQNIPFELRLREAIQNDLIVPFHYYGIRDKLVNYGSKTQSIIAKDIAKADNISFITEQIEKYRLSNEKLKCVAFCMNLQHCQLISDELNEVGYNSISLTGSNNIGERIKAFNDLQNNEKPLEIICTVDILNEGIDIPQINLVLFLRPTESQTIFIQQLGRGLRKYPGKDYVTVLDFIGNNHQRCEQIAFALGTLGKTTYMEKAYLKALILSDFKSIKNELPGLEIQIDQLSKEEIIDHIDKTKFATAKFMKRDYEIFKDYIKSGSYPTQMDYLDYDASPDLMRFIKSNVGGKNKSYYTFLRKIGEDVPLFSKAENDFIDNLEELLPLVRREEYLIVKQIMDTGRFDAQSIIDEYPKMNKESIEFGYRYLVKHNVLETRLDLYNTGSLFKKYVNDTINYGLTRYEAEFGDFDEHYKLYGNYTADQIAMVMHKEGSMFIKASGVYYDQNNKEIMFAFVDLDKEKGAFKFDDRFVDSQIFQWVSQNDVTLTNEKGKKLLAVKKVHLFIRKMKKEDGVTLPYTYFGTGILTNARETVTTSSGKDHPTLTFDIVLDHVVPEEYHLDFNITQEL